MCCQCVTPTLLFPKLLTCSCKKKVLLFQFSENVTSSISKKYSHAFCLWRHYLVMSTYFMLIKSFPVPSSFLKEKWDLSDRGYMHKLQSEVKAIHTVQSLLVIQELSPFGFKLAKR
uniref:Uncharacterized protein n=1 Tax=Micrurus surinamensis TaxID=129470 RepID=A0A2D4P6A9_MICSU